MSGANRPSSASAEVHAPPGEAQPWRLRVVAWLPAAVWAAFIFSMSSDEFSAEHTRGWIEPAIRFVLPGLGAEAVRLAHVVIRKLAHVSEYLVFAVLLDRAWRLDAPSRRVRPALAAFTLAALYSLSDEAHQAFVASRGASLVDCGIDSIGAALGALAASRRARTAGRGATAPR